MSRKKVTFDVHKHKTRLETYMESLMLRKLVRLDVDQIRLHRRAQWLKTHHFKFIFNELAVFIYLII